MKAIQTLGFLFVFLTQSLFANANELSEKNPCYTKLSEVLDCFVRYNDGVSGSSLLSKEEQDGLTVERYIFDSQKWPIEPEKSIETTVWKHKLVLYIPKQIEHNTVLLYVGGGYNRDKDGKDQNYNESKERLSFGKIAVTNKAIVVDLQDVPNQFLFMDDKFKREDQFLASTYKKVMNDPLKNAYLAGHLPMAKSVVKAMDFAQKLLSEGHKISDPRFVLAGASKRGWAVWLAALADSRVSAIVPIVIDILNTQKSILHTCGVYGTCPYALKDYAEEELTDKIDTKGFADLMKIEDPFNYLGSDYDAKYKERLAIPKLIINASGDDFFVPDSSQWYFKALPGNENHIRYLPNSLHYFRGNPISDVTQSSVSIDQAVESYFGFILNKTALPKVQWSFKNGAIEVVSSMKPNQVKLWSAFNASTRDFRYINTHTTWHLLKKKFLTYFTSRVCDTCYAEKAVEVSCAGSECKIQVPLPSVSYDAWRAAFVELHYEIAGREFIVSTEVAIERVLATKELKPEL